MLLEIVHILNKYSVSISDMELSFLIMWPLLPLTITHILGPRLLLSPSNRNMKEMLKVHTPIWAINLLLIALSVYLAPFLKGLFLSFFISNVKLSGANL